jgi:hypothetical protein
MHGLNHPQRAGIDAIVGRAVIPFQGVVIAQQKMFLLVIRQPGIVDSLQIKQVMVAINNVEIQIQAGKIRQVPGDGNILGHGASLRQQLTIWC